MRSLIDLYKQNDGYNRYGQDKFGHHYAELYDEIFRPLQDLPLNIFEIGFFTGGSCRLWLDYFVNAKIKCIDINEKANSKGSKWYIEDPRLELEIKDSNTIDEDYVKALDVDIFIDDGSHLLEDQLHIVKTVYPVLKEGALLIIEDVQNIEKVRGEFEKLGYPFSVADMRFGPATDSVLIIYKK